MSDLPETSYECAIVLMFFQFDIFITTCRTVNLNRHSGIEHHFHAVPPLIITEFAVSIYDPSESCFGWINAKYFLA